MNAREFARLIPGAKLRANGRDWDGRCRVHDDRHSSLTFRDGDRAVMVTCHAGCTVDAITRECGISVADLFFDRGSGNGSRRVVAEYAYVDLAGTLKYQTVRYEPKDFRQRRPDGIGAWHWNLDGVAPLPYRLPELAEAKRVYIVEGEKDADNLAALGLVATCNHGGAGKWRPEHTAALVAAAVPEVVVLPDNDEPGEQHARAVAASCRAAGLRTRILRLSGLPPKGDVSDWLAAGHTAAELDALADGAPDVACDESEPRVSTLGFVGVGAFIAQTFPEPIAVVEGLLSDDGGGFRGGEEKTLKTWGASDESLSIALGLPVFGRFAVPVRRRVMFLQEEDPPRRMHRRLRALLRGKGLDPDDPGVQADLSEWFRIAVWSGFTLDNPSMVEQLRAAVAEFRPTVVYIDCLRKVTVRDLNKAFEASMLLASLDAIRREFGTIFVLVHHFRKQQGFRTGRGSQEIGGSYVLGAWAENSLFFEPVGRKQGAVRVEVQSKDGAPVPGFTLRVESEGPQHAPTVVRLVAEQEQTEATAAVDEVVFQAVATLPAEIPVQGSPGVPVKTVAEAISKSKDSAQRAIDRLLDAGRVRRTGKGRRSCALYGVKDQ